MNRRVREVAICAHCHRTETNLGDDVWEPYCRDCPFPLGPRSWSYRNCTITQNWSLPKPGFRPQPDTFFWVHDDYDGAPYHSEDPGPADNRCGFSTTLDDACDAIDLVLGDPHE